VGKTDNQAIGGRPKNIQDDGKNLFNAETVRKSIVCASEFLVGWKFTTEKFSFIAALPSGKIIML
jgi:hypothetical protein